MKRAEAFYPTRNSCGSSRALRDRSEAGYQRLRLVSQRGRMGKNLPETGRDKVAVLSEDQAIGAFFEGVSPSMQAVEAVIREVAQSEAPVLLLAEGGAGKHATAQRIHEMSRR